MFDSPVVKGNINKSIESTKPLKVREPSQSGDKGEFFKEVEEKLDHHGNKKNDDDFYKPDEVELGNDDKENSNEENKESVSPKNQANDKAPGSMGKTLDIKI